MRSANRKKTQQYFGGYLSDNRGQTSLIITFTIMFLLVSAAFFLTNTSFKSLQAAGYIGKSSKSFYAAESGSEIYMYEKFKGAPPLELDAYAAGDIVICGCVTNNDAIKTAVASGSAVACGMGAGGDDCNAQNMYFNVEKIDNTKVKSTGGYQNIERAVKMQW